MALIRTINPPYLSIFFTVYVEKVEKPVYGSDSGPSNKEQSGRVDLSPDRLRDAGIARTRARRRRVDEARGAGTPDGSAPVRARAGDARHALGRARPLGTRAFRRLPAEQAAGRDHARAGRPPVPGAARADRLCDPAKPR